MRSSDPLTICHFQEERFPNLRTGEIDVAAVLRPQQTSFCVRWAALSTQIHTGQRAPVCFPEANQPIQVCLTLLCICPSDMNL